MHLSVAGKLTGRISKWVVLVAVVVAVAGLTGLGSKLADVKDNQASSWLPGSAEATKVADELSKAIDPNDIPTLVTYYRKGGLTEADLAEIEAQGAEIAKVKGITAAGVLTPAKAAAAAAQGANVPTLVSPDGEVAYSYFTMNLGKDGWNKLKDPITTISDETKIDGVTTYLGGAGGQAYDFINSFEGSNTTLLGLTFLAVLIILFVTYRSPVLPFLPLITAGLALQASNGVIYLLAKYAGLTVNDQSEYILGILVIGAGTDYALLLTARYREELRNHQDRHEAMAFALHRAAPAIIASAATVVIGLMCLGLAQLNSTASLGPVLAVGVAVTMIMMLVLYPAILVILGRWIFWPQRPRFGSAEPTATGFWSKIGTRVQRRPRAVWLVTGVLLLVACAGLGQLNPVGLNSKDSYTTTFNSIKAQELLADHGLADNSVTLQVVADTDKIGDATAALTGVEGVGRATDPIAVGDGRSYVEASIPDDPLSPSAFDKVKAARSAVHAIDGADAKVGGMPAVYYDTNEASAHDSKLIIPIVLLVVLLILILLLRALVAPVILIVTVVLSFAASLGISALVFRHVFGFAGTNTDFPLFAFVFLVALGIDYNIFLMTRVREESATLGTRRGSLVALASTGGVITSAGMVLAVTFAALGTLPFVFLAELGFAVALGVLLDTMIVRSVLVTAINLDLGSKIWWPSRLDRTEA
ncbi:MAG: MMPL family transporter [Nocardioides sp.]|uniref:MMPL family transporter n=1 Tax=Nocardioides sp. TaxID=35761 RepID=UPI0039E60CF8